MVECAPLSMGHSGNGIEISHIPNHTSLINLRNIPNGDQCFLFALAAALKYDEAAKKKNGLNAKCKVYTDFVKTLNTTGITFPIDTMSIEKFLRQNKQLNIIIHIYSIFDGKVYPSALNLGADIQSTGKDKKEKKKDVVAMLSVDVKTSEESSMATSHLIPIRSLDGFLARRYDNNSKYYK